MDNFDVAKPQKKTLADELHEAAKQGNGAIKEERRRFWKQQLMCYAQKGEMGCTVRQHLSNIDKEILKEENISFQYHDDQRENEWWYELSWKKNG